MVPALQLHWTHCCRVGTYALVGVSLALHAKLHALAALPAADVCAALVAVHAASRWSCAPLVYCCRYLQDEEDAKAGLYNWFAASRRLLTPPRLLISTAVAAVLPLVLLGPVRGAGVLVAVVAVTACAGWYGTLVLGGVVGDFLGATIQV
jgi:adenosylcobinamide-GDP ribazoletransferase